jgi:hypothetical protein
MIKYNRSSYFILHASVRVCGLVPFFHIFLVSSQIHSRFEEISVKSLSLDSGPVDTNIVSFKNILFVLLF